MSEETKRSTNVGKRNRKGAIGLAAKIFEMVEKGNSTNMRHNRFVKNLMKIMGPYSRKDCLKAMAILEKEMADDQKSLNFIKSVMDDVQPDWRKETQKASEPEPEKSETPKVRIIHEAEAVEPTAESHTFKDNVKYGPGIMRANMSGFMAKIAFKMKYGF